MATPLDFTLEEVEKMPLAAQTILMKDHVMEKDKETILSLLGAILLLCSSKASRTFLRDNNIVSSIDIKYIFMYIFVIQKKLMIISIQLLENLINIKKMKKLNKKLLKL